MQTKAPLVALALALAACGSSPGASSPPTNSKSVKVPISGHVALMPIPPGAPNEDFSDLNVHVLNPAALMVNPTRVLPLASAQLDTADSACTMQACPFTVDEVNVAAATMGLVGQVKDAGKALRWAPVYTGIVSPDAAKSASASNSAIENNVIFAVPMESMRTVADSLGMTVDALTAQGLLIGIATAPLRETSPAIHLPTPVEGVNVTVAGLNTCRVNIMFPNDEYTVSSSTGGTNADGIFFAVGTAGGNNMPFTTTLKFEDPTGARAWKPQMAGIGPSFTLVTGYPAD